MVDCYSFDQLCRIVVVKQEGSRLSDEIVKFNVGEEAPYRMILHPSGGSIVISLALGGLKVVNIKYNAKEAGPIMSWPAEPVKTAAANSSNLGVIKCMSFSSDGSLLAIGTEDGRVFILAWPSLSILKSVEACPGRAVRNIDFSSAHNDGVLFVVDDSGKCSLWSTDKLEYMSNLTGPKDKARFSIFRCLSTTDALGIVVYGAGTCKGEGYALRWRQTEEGELVLDSKIKSPAIRSPISGMELSHDGKLLAAVTPDGEQGLISTETLKCVKFVRRAHMTFATAVAFSPDDTAIISVSADASATLCMVPKATNSSIAVLLAILFAILAVAIHMLRSYGKTNPEKVMDALNTFPWLKGFFNM